MYRKILMLVMVSAPLYAQDFTTALNTIDAALTNQLAKAQQLQQFFNTNQRQILSPSIIQTYNTQIAPQLVALKQEIAKVDSDINALQTKWNSLSSMEKSLNLNWVSQMTFLQAKKNQLNAILTSFESFTRMWQDIEALKNTPR